MFYLASGSFCAYSSLPRADQTWKSMALRRFCKVRHTHIYRFQKLDQMWSFVGNESTGGLTGFRMSMTKTQWKTSDKRHVGMEEEDFESYRNSFASILKGCVNVDFHGQGRMVHTKMVKFGFQQDIFLASRLLNMYVKCGTLTEARQLFDEMVERNVVIWTEMITGYGQQAYGEEALELFSQMQRAGINPDLYVFTSVLRACASIAALEQGKQLHSLIIKVRFQSDVYVGSALVDMYVKCSKQHEARKVFDKIPARNVISWTTMIAGYAQNGYGGEALKLFCEMQCEDIKPNEYTLASVLSACSSVVDFKQGRQAHVYVIKSGFESSVNVVNALVNMYAKCGCIEDARQLFDKMPERNVVSWTAMISGYAQDCCTDEALKLFCQMRQAGVKPDELAFTSALWACANQEALKHGKQIHAHLIRIGFELPLSVRNALVDMYAKCGCLKDARHVFDNNCEQDVASWSAIIAGYLQCGYGEEALRMFRQMQSVNSMPDQLIFASALWACASIGSLEEGMQVHAKAIRSGFETNSSVGNSLLTMYVKSGSIEYAYRVFDKMLERNAVSWSMMIAGDAHYGNSEDAMKLFSQMLQMGIKPDQFTFTSVLKACTNIASLEQGKKVHAHIIKSVFALDVFVGSALVDMYAKCGSVEDAWQWFNQMPEQNVVSWTTMISGYAQNGHGMHALHLFEEMLLTGMKPDHITFVGVLSACSHVGLVDEGHQYFCSMSQDHCITPTIQHYACMVDLLGRAGCLDQADELIKKMPLEPDAIVWGALLSACRIHGNTELGKYAAERLLELEPRCVGTHVLLANIYAKVGEWEDAANVRKMIKDKGLKKQPGCSWIEVKDKVHAFVADDRSHPQTERIYALLDRLAEQMKQAGYVPNTDFVLHDVEEEQKEIDLWHHSEKLAIAFGLINTLPGIPIRITKNLRVCGDCHTATKFISQIVGRDIVMRDSNRFHHFKNGICTCGDYW
eukprot:Gb_07617 [translate_table: standard]